VSVLVTGSGGQLGSELCRQLGREATGVDLPELDLTDRESVLRMLAEIRPGAVINAAAYTLVDRAEDEAERCRAVNVEGVTTLAEACRRLECPLVQISSDYVFGGDLRRRTPYRETDEPSPRGVYARSKLDSEREAARCPDHLIVRTCGLYGHVGPRSAGNFVETMLRLGSEGRSLRVVDDQRCTPSFAVHVARAVVFLLRSGTRGTFHVVAGGETTWFDFAREVFRLAGLEVDVSPTTTAEYGLRAARPTYSVLDTAKYLGLPGRPPLPHWREALAEYLRSRV
jgi:dTDP-4-dehydrorhamnose reductase